MPDPDSHTSPRTDRLVDPDTGKVVHLVYAIPPELIQGGEGGDEDGISLLDLGKRLWAGKWLIILCAVLGGGLGVGYALLQPNVYTAKITALPPSDQGSGGTLAQYAGLAAMAGVQLPSGPASSVDEIMAILESRRLAEPLIEEFDLVAYYAPEATEPPKRENILDAFAGDFSSNHSTTDNRITFSYTHQNPTTAAAVANRAATLLTAIFNDIHQSAAKREVAFLQDRLAQTEAALDKATTALTAFQHETGTIEIEAQTKATIEAVAGLQGELIAQQVELRALLASQASEDNPRIQLLQERITAATDEMRRLLGSDTDADGVLVALGKAPELSVRYLTLLREVKKHQAVLAGVTAQLQAAEVSQIRDSEAVSIVDHAPVPERKSGPARARISILACILGTMLGTALALVRGWRRSGEG